MELRLVRREDRGAVIDLVRVTLAEFGIAFGEGSETDAQLSELPESYTRDGGAFFVAEHEGRIVGTAGVSALGGVVFELRKMYLAPTVRGSGLGQRLLDACVAHVRVSGGRYVVLDTTEKMQAAIHFYERNGFVRDDTQRRASRCTRGYRLDLT